MNRIRAILLVGAILPVGACGDPPTVPEIDSPFFYLVLYPGKVWDGIGEGTSYAMALTLHTTVDVRCRSVETLAMSRESDGAPFAWRLEGSCEAVSPFSPRFPGTSCCTLPLTHSDSLGGEDLAAGESYVLAVESEGWHLEGRTRIPSPFSVRVVQRTGAFLAEWSRSAGAVAYAVTDGNYDVHLTTDTTLTLPAEAFERFVHVEAMDENMYRYVSGQAVRSGIDSGQGLFGAMWSPGPTAY